MILKGKKVKEALVVYCSFLLTSHPADSFCEIAK